MLKHDDSAYLYHPKISAKVFLPFYNIYVPAGMPSPAEPYEDLCLDLNDYLGIHQSDTFIIRVQDTSMQAFGVQKDDLIVVNRNVTHRHGAIVLIEYLGQLTLYKLETKNRMLCFKSWKSLEITPKAGTDCIVLGVVTHVIHKL